MKKILFVLLGLFISACVYAESPQLQFIKEMYDSNISKLKADETKDNKSDYRTIKDHYSFFSKYLDDNIKRLYSIYTKEKSLDETPLGLRRDCNYFYYLFIWMGLYLDPSAKLTFSEPSENMVQVTVGATKKTDVEGTVTYLVRCQKDGDCKIADIYKWGNFFTQHLAFKCGLL